MKISCASFSDLADVSVKKSKLFSSLNFIPCSLVTKRDSSKSDLFPIKNIFKSGEELCSFI